MSSIHRKPRKLERYRKSHKGPVKVVREGKGKSLAREASELNLKVEAQKKKLSNKLVKELETLSVEDLKSALSDSRQELFNLRFRHATGQLENVSSLPLTRQRIARILTLIKQKEVGA